MILTLLVRNSGKMGALSVPSCVLPRLSQLRNFLRLGGKKKPFVSACDKLAVSVAGLAKETKVKE